jgi:hypothetical protein
MALSKKEKLALLAAIVFMHNYGNLYVPMVKGGTKEENEEAWKEARVIYKGLHSRIKQSLDAEQGQT